MVRVKSMHCPGCFNLIENGHQPFLLGFVVFLKWPTLRIYILNGFTLPLMALKDGQESFVFRSKDLTSVHGTIVGYLLKMNTFLVLLKWVNLRGIIVFGKMYELIALRQICVPFAYNIAVQFGQQRDRGYWCKSNWCRFEKGRNKADHTDVSI